MNRYSDVIEVINSNGKKRYETLYYPVFTPQDTDIYIISKTSDRLDLLANEYYGDPRLWWVITRANSLEKGTLRIKPGLKIRIPFPLDNFDVINMTKNINF